MNIPMFLTLVAKPFVISREQLFFAESVEALIYAYSLLLSIITILVFLFGVNNVFSKTFVISSIELINDYFKSNFSWMFQLRIQIFQSNFIKTFFLLITIFVLLSLQIAQVITVRMVSSAKLTFCFSQRGIFIFFKIWQIFFYLKKNIIIYPFIFSILFLFLYFPFIQELFFFFFLENMQSVIVYFLFYINHSIFHIKS